MERMKVGIIGTGQATSISRGHLQGIQMCENAELIGIYDVNQASAEAWCEAFGCPKDIIYSSCEKLMEDADVISICTPNHTHADYVCECLGHNTHVLCEKPISNTGKDIDRIRKAMEETTANGRMNLCYRLIPAIGMLHELIGSGQIGRIYTIRHNMGGSRLANEAIPLEWRFLRSVSGTGVIGDFGSHAIDILHYILGAEESRFEQLQAFDSTFIKERMSRGEMSPVENEDCAMLVARLSCGALYNLTLSRVGTVESFMEIVGSHGIVQYFMNQPDRLFIQRRKDGEAYTPVETVVCATCREEWHGLPYNEVPYLASAENMCAFLELLLQGGENSLDLRYGIQILEETENIARAVEENKERKLK